MKIKKNNGVLSVVFTLVMIFSLMSGSTAFAAEVPQESSAAIVSASVENEVQPRGTLSGYGSTTVTKTSGKKTFNVPVSGNYSTGAGMTLKTSGNSDAFGYITVYKPDGSVYKNQVNMTGNQERKFQLYFVKGGTYKVEVDFYVPSGSVTAQCWIYA